MIGVEWIMFKILSWAFILMKMQANLMNKT